MKQIVSDICLEELKKSLKTAKLFYIINQENKSQNPQNQNVRDLEAHLSPLIGYYKVSLSFIRCTAQTNENSN